VLWKLPYTNREDNNVGEVDPLLVGRAHVALGPEGEQRRIVKKRRH
jgi:hypothetical protein